MARLNDAQTSALADWWNLLRAEASLGTTVTDVQVVAAATAANAGRSLTFEESTAIAVLYGYARRLDNAATAFQGADLADTITPDLIGIPPWARDQQVMNTAPIWHSTFEFTYIDQAGNQQTDFRTSVFTMTLPSTVGELTDALQSDAEAMAQKYEVTLVGINPIELLAV